MIQIPANFLEVVAAVPDAPAGAPAGRPQQQANPAPGQPQRGFDARRAPSFGADVGFDPAATDAARKPKKKKKKKIQNTTLGTELRLQDQLGELRASLERTNPQAI